jgi:hypothetical protein
VYASGVWGAVTSSRVSLTPYPILRYLLAKSRDLNFQSWLALVLTIRNPIPQALVQPTATGHHKGTCFIPWPSIRYKTSPKQVPPKQHEMATPHAHARASTSNSTATLVNPRAGLSETSPLLKKHVQVSAPASDVDDDEGSLEGGKPREGREVEVYKPGKSTFSQTVSFPLSADGMVGLTMLAPKRARRYHRYRPARVPHCDRSCRLGTRPALTGLCRRSDPLDVSCSDDWADGRAADTA